MDMIWYGYDFPYDKPLVAWIRLLDLSKEPIIYDTIQMWPGFSDPGGGCGSAGAHFDLHSLKPRLSLKIKLEDVFLFFFWGGGKASFQSS